jgi:hypothetical protein
VSWGWGATGHGFAVWGSPGQDSVGRGAEMRGAVRRGSADRHVNGWGGAM